MWLLNVVEIITFLFFIAYGITRTIKQRDIVNDCLVILALIFEIIFLVYVMLGKSMSNTLQGFVLAFAFIIPMIMFAIKNASKYFKLKILYAVAVPAYTFKKYEFVAGLLEKAIKYDKANVNYYYLRAKALKRMREYADARDMMFKVVELDRENAVAYYDLAELLDLLDKKDTAIVMLATALKILPSYEEAKEMMGIIYSEIGRYKEAASIYEEMSSEGIGSFNTYYNLAIIYSEQGEIEKAIDAYNVALQKNNKLYDAYYSLGRLYYAKEDYEKAIGNLKRAAKDSKLKAKAYYSMAMTYVKLEDYVAAVDYLEKAVNINKEYILKAKEDMVFDPIIAEVNRIADDNTELLVQEFSPEDVESE